MHPLRTAYVALSGEYDIHNIRALEEVLPSPHTIDRITIDCTGVTYMDTAALGALIKYRGVFAFENGEPDITIVLRPGPLQKIFEIVGFMKIFNVVESPNAEGPTPQSFYP
jgi:anti-anti-sigma factor